jgi:hypothetical protein
MDSIVIDIDELPGRLDEMAALWRAGTRVVVRHASGTTNEVTFYPVDPPPPGTPMRTIVLGLHAGSIVMAPDFNDPLPDEFWDGAFS